MSPEVLQELDLAQSTLGQDLLAEDIGDLLDRDTLVCLVVYRCAVTGNAPQRSANGPDVLLVDQRFGARAVAPDLPDDAVSTLTQLFCNGVTFIDDEVLIEDLEHFPAL